MTMEAPELNLYEYAVIRYVPSVEREEFVNVGLVMMCKRRRWIRAELTLDGRKMDLLRLFNAPHSREEIERQLSAFTGICIGDPAYGPIAALPVEERFRWLTAVKSASISTSRPHPGKTPDLEATFDRLLSTLA